jgi:hypothetical protein
MGDFDVLAVKASFVGGVTKFTKIVTKFTKSAFYPPPLTVIF